MKLSPIYLHDIKQKILNNQISVVILYGDTLVVEYVKLFILKLFNANKTVELDEFYLEIKERDFFGKNCIITEVSLMKKINFIELLNACNFSIIISNENFSSYIKPQNKFIGFINCYLTESQAIEFIQSLIPNNIKINKDIIKIIINKCTVSNLGAMQLETEKLIHNCNSHNLGLIAKDDVEKIVSNYNNNAIDDLFFALINGDSIEYFKLLENISAESILIIRVFLKYMNNFLHVKQLALDGLNARLETIKLKIFFKYVDQFILLVNSLTVAKINKILELIYNLEHMYKSYPNISFNALFTKLYADIKLI